MRQAISLAADPAFVPGPNPRVGCVILSRTGDVLGAGAHLGAGTDHAEVVALKVAGARAAGATAVVTLEPCAHHGRTPPCAEALIAAGVGRVVFAQSDPNPAASGGAEVLRTAKVSVVGDVLAAQARALNVEWSIAVERGWPFVTSKVAATLDGRVAARDGSSRWITGPEARQDAHKFRGVVGAVLVGTGTALSDDPELTDRRPSAVHQPQAAIMGMRAIPRSTKLATRDPILLQTHDVGTALHELFNLGIRHVLVEGGPTVTAAFFAAGRVDQLVWYLSPKLLGDGRSAVDSLGIEAVDGAMQFQVTSLRSVGEDIRVDLAPMLDASETG